MTAHRLSGASFPLTALLLAVAVHLTVGLVTMEVPESATSPGPRFFPTCVTVLAYAVAAALAVQSTRQLLRDRRQKAAPEPTGGTGTPEVTGAAEDASAEAPEAVDWRRVAIVVGSFVAFILLLEVLGWLLSAALLVVGVATGLGARSLFTTICVGLTMSAVVQLVFVGGLGLSLPAGFLGGL